jgi:hypothetical protein
MRNSIMTLMAVTQNTPSVTSVFVFPFQKVIPTYKPHLYFVLD